MSELRSGEAFDAFVFDQFDVLAKHWHMFREDAVDSAHDIEYLKSQVRRAARQADLGRLAFGGFQATYNLLVGRDPQDDMLERLEPIVPMHNIVHRLQAANRPVFVFTNAAFGVTNAVMELGHSPRVPEENIFESGALGVAKPDPEAFQLVSALVMEASGVEDPSRVYFVDNDPGNVAASIEHVGWTAEVFDPLNADTEAARIAARIGLDLPPTRHLVLVR